MTALHYYMDTDRVCIAMDTCSLNLEANGDRTPGPFCSKLLFVPHMRMIVCGTGVRGMIYNWFAVLNQDLVARNIVEVDDVVVETLKTLANHHGVSDKLTSTIYHFGYVEEAERMAGIAYRSTNGFEGDQLEYGLGIKPPDGIDLPGAFKTCHEQGVPAGFIEVMKRQKLFDDFRPPSERLGIGGEIQFATLDKSGYQLHTCHRFEGYDDHYASVRSRCQSP